LDQDMGGLRYEPMRNKTKRTLFFLGFFEMVYMLCLAGLLTARPTAQDVRTFTLKNGMKVLVLADHTIPQVMFQIFFKVGSRNEYPGITGISHFLEHMMFNGSENFGPKMFDRILEDAGGSSNAYTGKDLTSYQDWVPKGSLEQVFQLEADRLKGPALEESVVEKERGVVLSEYLTTYENSHHALLEDQLNAVAFQVHPYRRPVIGYESDIRRWQVSDIRSYFDRYYGPNNALLAVVGDVSFDRVRALAETYLEPIPPRPTPPPLAVPEPPQRGEKRLVVEKEVSSPHLLIAFHVPATGAADYYALKMLSVVLSQGKSSRLYRALIQDRALATEVSTYMYESLDPTLFYIYAVCADGVSAGSLEKAVLRELRKVVEKGITEHELGRARKQVLASFYGSLQRISDKADLLGTYEIFWGGYENLFRFPEACLKVRRADIRAAAAKYFLPSNRTVGVLRPRRD